MWILVSAPLFAGAATGETGGIAPLDPAFSNYLRSQETGIYGGEDLEHPLGYVPSPLDLSYLQGQTVASSRRIYSLPTSYDLRTLGRVTPVRSQGSCGACWSFATYASLESSLLPDESKDFSENNLKNNHGFDLGPCSGGNATMATAYLARWGGPVLEADDPYVPYSWSADKHVQEILLIPPRSSSTDNDNIKQAVMTYGVVYTTMYWNSTYYNSTHAAYYYNGSATHNHAVAIVGWDDQYSRYNFNSTPPGDGAFIIKNSWGTGFGQSGYFYISYYDTMGTMENAVFHDAEPVTHYTGIYQYDPLGWTTSYGYGSTTAWGANVFTAASDDPLVAVAFHVAAVGSSYEIYVYTNVGSSPTSGVLAASKSGSVVYPGYHTIPLDSPVSLVQGEKFSVVVKFTTPGYVYPIPIEYPISGYSSNATASTGQSYVSSNGTYWTDIAAQYANTNVCIKAFSGEASSQAPSADFTGTPLQGTAPLTVAFSDASSGDVTAWAWAFGDGGTSTEQNPSHQYTSPGVYTVTLTVTGPGGSDTETKTDYVTVCEDLAITSFTADPSSITTGESTTLTWSIQGAASASIEPGIGAVDPSSGSVTVSPSSTTTYTLTATNACGSVTETQTIHVWTTHPHCADFEEPFWTVDGTEANRVLAYWRAQGYHPDPDGSDGYAPGMMQGYASKGLTARKGLVGADDPTAAHSAPADYVPGGTVTVTNTFIYSGTLLSLMWTPTLPDGWSIESVSGDGNPELQYGDIVWTGTLPPSPVQMTYTVRVPSSESGTKQIRAQVEFHFDGETNARNVYAGPDPLELASSSYHSADYRDPRWVIDGTEANRVLAYWRAGGYHPDPDGADGYAPGIDPVSRNVNYGRQDLQSATHSVSSTTYTPGSTIQVQTTLAYSGTLLSLMWRPLLPNGWVIESVSGDGAPEIHYGEIVWTGTLPSSPVRMTYTVRIPPGESGTRSLQDEVEVHFLGAANPVTFRADPDPIPLAPASEEPEEPHPSGIYKSTDGTMNAYVQVYSTGSMVVLLTQDFDHWYVFLDPDWTDGMQGAEDLAGEGHRLTWSFESDSRATATLAYAGGGAATWTLDKTFEAPDPQSRLDGIYKPQTGGMNAYVQTYATGSVVVVLTPDLVHWYVFLDPNWGDGVEMFADLAGEGYAFRMTARSNGSRECTLTDAQGKTDTFVLWKLFEGK